MEVKRFAEAKTYAAPNHRNYASLRLFGLDAGGPKQFVVGLSHFLPGGGAGPDASPTEKGYVVLTGELTVMAGGQGGGLKGDNTGLIGPDEGGERFDPRNHRVTKPGATS